MDNSDIETINNVFLSLLQCYKDEEMSKLSIPAFFALFAFIVVLLIVVYTAHTIRIGYFLLKEFLKWTNGLTF